VKRQLVKDVIFINWIFFSSYFSFYWIAMVFGPMGGGDGGVHKRGYTYLCLPNC